jgi:hypothetical protein
MTIRGIDFAFAPHPGVAQMKAAGVHWVGRYVSPLAINDANGKNLTPPECQAYKAAGLAMVLFAEQSAGRMLEGRSAGVADATHFESVVKNLGLTGIAMYCCADFDAAPGQQQVINSYLDGAASVVGRARTGIYGSYYVVNRSLDAGKAHYACQTVAWSGGQWAPRAHIRQHLQFRVGGVSVDLDEAMRTDYGQWPRPPLPQAPPATPVRLAADGVHTFRQLIHAHSTTIARALYLMAHDPDKVKSGRYGHVQSAFIAGNDFDKVPPKGMIYWAG